MWSIARRLFALVCSNPVAAQVSQIDRNVSMIKLMGLEKLLEPNNMIELRLVRIVTLFACWIAGLGLLTTTSSADDMRSERIQIPSGESGVTIIGSITGYNSVDYKLYGCGEQDIVINLTTDNASSYYNILAPGETQVAMFIGSVEGNRYEGRLPESGDYTIRVYLMRSAARRGEKANYKLDITVAGTRTLCQSPIVKHGPGLHG